MPISLVDPLPYLDFVQLMANASCVLTDSGGSRRNDGLGIPCLTLRKKTERPITVSRGTNRVIGVEPARSTTTGVRPSADSGPRSCRALDGKAAQRIVRILLEAR